MAVRKTAIAIPVDDVPIPAVVQAKDNARG
jgi:hypothetical protein